MSGEKADPLFVRLGVRYIRSRHGKLPPSEDTDGIHVLNEEERANIKRIARNMVLRAACAGALSTLTSGAVEVAAQPLLAAGDTLRFYLVLGVATALAAVLEIMFLYWDALRSVHELSRAAGLTLFTDEDEKNRLAATMARAALEMPNPRLDLEGIDPLREASRVRLVFASIAYKAKVSATNFLFKALFRRAVGRAALRTYAPLVAVPFTALWDAVVAYLIVREAKLRVMGPSAARALVAISFPSEGALSLAAGEAALRAIGASIVKKEDLHPNLLALFREIVRRSPDAKATSALDDTKAFLARVRELDQTESAFVLRILCIASILDGRLSKREKVLLAAAYSASGRVVDLGAIDALRVAFVNGDELDNMLVNKLVGESTSEVARTPVAAAS